MDNELYHFGTPRHSGRYPYGSGENPYQHEGFLKTVSDMKAQGLSETEIARGLDMSTTELRARKSIASNEKRASDIRRVKELYDTGMSKVAIGKELGLPESTVRNYLKPTLQARTDRIVNAKNVLTAEVDKKKFVDVGVGVEKDMGISETCLKTAIAAAQTEGYNVYSIKMEQMGNPGKYTTIKVLTPPDATWSDAYKNRMDIKPVANYSNDNGETFLGIKPPTSVSSDRVYIRYAEDGGTQQDGTIQLRRNVKDLSLGNSSYAQVRIAVDGSHYLKGMALYSDEIPKGYDIVFNTNKHKGTPKEKVFKELKSDPDNPFGATISRQIEYEDSDGTKKLSPINIVNEEGKWNEWSRTLSSQFLSKQNLSLINKQLDLTYANKLSEFEEIKNCTNSVVKQKLLESFADDCDSSAVKLKAVGLSGQTQKVILPITSMKDTEIYAPGYENGTHVALVRHPHGGTFEIPILTVNNKNATAKSVLGNAVDAVGINASVAERLSGADFDGDTVLVLPTGNRAGDAKIKSTPALKGLEGFDPKESYPYREGMKVMTPSLKQTEMGKVSNLITDMTLGGAQPDELARAVRHSMVVIDAEKHKLDYTQSYIDNGIAELKKKYQGGVNAGASTLISRAKSKAYIPERTEGQYYTDPKTGKTTKKYINPETGEKLYTDTGRTYEKTTKSGTTKVITATQESTKMEKAFEEGKDAFSLSSGTPVETAYANYANNVKALANEARKEMVNTQNYKYSPSAKAAYANEVASLKAKLNIALSNAPRERQAQVIANAIFAAKKRDNPDMDRDDEKKLKSQALAAARVRCGAKKESVTITDKEWEAIQAHAISATTLSKILNNADLDSVKKLATPKQTNQLSDINISRIKAYNNSGYTIAEIADAMGISTSTVSKYIKS